MEKEIKCPVCGKPGIPDYHSDDVVCPCCGSDLSIYRIIDQIPHEGTVRNIWKPISAVAILAAVVMSVLVFTQKPTVDTNTKEVAQLKDSIVVLNNKLQEKVSVQTPASLGFAYVVKRGESFWSISQKFYGTGTRAEDIARNNNKTLDTYLFVGDTLIIK